MKAITTYLKNVRAEMAHVVWPDRRQALIHTVLIILISALVALLIAGLDYVFTSIVTYVVEQA
jgi:preprotein translocase SecE subunit